MTRRWRTQRHNHRGSSVLYVILLSPILFLSLALAVELGALQLERQRFHSAVDEAVIIAAEQSANVHDVVNLDRQQTDSAVRQALADNFTPLQANLADQSIDDIVRSADVVVITSVPSADPFQAGITIRNPSIETRVQVPVKSGLLNLAGLPASVTFTLVSSSDIRVTGAT